MGRGCLAGVGVMLPDHRVVVAGVCSGIVMEDGIHCSNMLAATGR